MQRDNRVFEAITAQKCHVSDLPVITELYERNNIKRCNDRRNGISGNLILIASVIPNAMKLQVRVINVPSLIKVAAASPFFQPDSK